MAPQMLHLRALVCNCTFSQMTKHLFAHLQGLVKRMALGPRQTKLESVTTSYFSSCGTITCEVGTSNRQGASVTSSLQIGQWPHIVGADALLSLALAHGPGKRRWITSIRSSWNTNWLRKTKILHRFAQCQFALRRSPTLPTTQNKCIRSTPAANERGLIRETNTGGQTNRPTDTQTHKERQTQRRTNR